MIRLTDLEKSFDTKPSPTYVLRRIDLTIQPGEFVTIMGPSGAESRHCSRSSGCWTGSTGVNMIQGTAGPTSQAKQRAELAKQSVGFVFQQYHLLDDLTVAENLDMPFSYRDLRSSERAALVADALDRFHIVGKKDLYPRQLSGGQQQLIAVARAIIAKPALLLADEPTGNLHSAQGREIMELFCKLNAAGTTIMQVTHSLKTPSMAAGSLSLKTAGWLGITAVSRTVRRPLGAVSYQP